MVKKIAIENISSLTFFMHVFNNVFSITVKKHVFYVFYLQINVFNIYIANTKVNSAFHSCGVSKSSTSLPVWLALRCNAFTCVGWHIPTANSV